MRLIPQIRAIVDAAGGGGVDTANSPAAGEFAKFTDADTIEGRTTSETRTDLGLVIGTNVQAFSANLDEYAAVNPTAAGLALLDDADAAAQRTTMGAAATSHTHPIADLTDDGALAALNTVGTTQIDNDAVTYAKIQNVTDARLLGRSAGSSGDCQEITVGSGLSLAAGALTATGGGSSPGGQTTEVQFNNGGAFVTSALITQSTSTVRFDLWDTIRLQVQLDTNGSGGLGSGNGNGIIRLWVNNTQVINDSTVNIVNGNSTVGMGRIFCAGPTAWTRDNTTQSWDQMQVVSDASLLSGGAITLASWTNSQRALAWIYPPTDAASQNYWHSRMAPTDSVGDNPWLCALSCIGGGYPFNFSILTGPTGLQVVSVGFDIGKPPYYTYLRWSNPQIGTHPITIRCTDQNGSFVDRSWTLQVFADTDTTRFVYINSATGNNSNSGTRALPKLNINGWYNGTDADSANQTKQVFYIGGPYNIGGVSGITYNGSQLTMPDSKPRTHWPIGWPNNIVTINGNGAWWNPEGMTSGLYMGPFRHQDALTGGTQMFFESDTAAFTGGGTFGYQFIYAIGATQDSTNSSGIFLQTPLQAFNVFAAFIGNIVDGMTANNAGFKNYNGCDLAFEGWTFKNCSSGIMHHMKGGDIRRVSILGFDASENNNNPECVNIEYINNPIQRSDIDVGWANVNIADNLFLFTVSGTTDNFQRINTFRCNIRCPNPTNEPAVYLNNNSGTIGFEDHIILHSGGFVEGIRNNGTGAILKTNLVTATSGLLNATTGLRIGGPIDTNGCEMILI